MEVRGTQWQKGSVLVADGAWGTEFFKRGLMQGSPPDEWNLTHPEIVREITREYLEAGADIVLTNTFGANKFRLEPHGLSDRVKAINASAASIAREVSAGRALVAGDIGPCARFLSLGEVTPEELYDVFAEQARAHGNGHFFHVRHGLHDDPVDPGIAERAGLLGKRGRNGRCRARGRRDGPGAGRGKHDV